MSDSPGASQSVRLSHSSEMRGIVGYMAPEQVNDAAKAGPAADVFAFGTIFYECFAGEPAFSGKMLIEVMAKTMKSERKPFWKLCRDVPAWLDAVVDRSMALELSKRFATGAELAAKLEE